MERKTKNLFLTQLVALSAFLNLSQSQINYAADEPPSDSSTEMRGHEHKKALKRAFRVGVCVGQELSDEGITVPHPEAEKKPSYDTATRKAFRKAIKECKAELKKAGEVSTSDNKDPHDIYSEEDEGETEN